MHFEQLQYIAEIGKQGSIITAAEKLHVSPPAISKSISKLEKELGIQIFKRSKTGMVPTHQGKAVIKKAFEVISKIDELMEEAKYQEGLAKTKLKISCVPGLTYSAYNSLIKLHIEFPEAIIEIHEMATNQILKDVKNGNCDIGLFPAAKTDLKDEINIIYEKLGKGSPCICVGKNSPFAFHEFVTPEDLQNECFVSYIKGEYTNALLKTYFSKNRVVIRTNNIEIIRKAIKDGVGNAFAFEEIFKNDADVLNGDIIIVPLKNCELPKPISAIYVNERLPSPFARKFLKYVQDFWE
ncbi:LysR family transcriptional regulator [Neobacillus sp. NRS-1170]|uniref:LysR family transcriptional regulator n=1 Tax=Neobacillus sp. NRS-1170 TaxID=3233898 RepID=UPI003D2B0FC4